MICRVCARTLISWGAAARIPLLRCTGCGAIHAECEKPDEDLYASEYSKDEPVLPIVAASLDAVVRSMAPFRTHGKWLDIGFGQGALLEAAARGGWECHGTEISDVALAKGRKKGFNTSQGTQTMAKGYFDVVSLVELIEHVERPGEILVEARRVLRPGGVLYITTPNAWSLNRWILGDAWTVFSPPDHVTIFTPGALKTLLRNSGFEKVGIRAEGLSPFEMIRRFRGRSEEGAHRVNEGTALCASMNADPKRRQLKKAINAFLSATRVGDSLKARAS